MSKNAFNKFFTKTVTEIDGLQSKLYASANMDEFASIAVEAGKASGVAFTAEDVKASMAANVMLTDLAVSDEALESVAGGRAVQKAVKFGCDGSWDHTNGLATDTACCISVQAAGIKAPNL